MGCATRWIPASAGVCDAVLGIQAGIGCLMWTLIARRAAQALPVMLGISIITFVLIY